MKMTLQIPVVEGAVHLGCSAQERKKPQKVRVGIKIKFKHRAPACETDDLEATPCYAEMTEILQKIFNKKHYQTIEHLCFACTESIGSYLLKFNASQGAKLSLSLTKVAPPVAAIKAGSMFTIEQHL